MHIALYQPDIAANAAAAVRLAARLHVPLTLVEPCGFVWDERRLRRLGLDYLDHASIERFASWVAFEAWRGGGRAPLVVLTTRAAHPHHRIADRPDDLLIVDQESSGVPDQVRAATDPDGAARTIRRLGNRRRPVPSRRQLP